MPETIDRVVAPAVPASAAAAPAAAAVVEAATAAAEGLAAEVMFVFNLGSLGRKGVFIGVIFFKA